MNNNLHFADLLKIERKRLGLSQEDIAQKCGVSRQIWGKYERDEVMPGGEVLSAFVGIGGDVQYIFSGVRSSFALSATERLFLEKLRGSEQVLQDRALRVLLGEQPSPSFMFDNAGANITNQMGTNTAPINIDMRKNKK